ncbi:hypothetical protein [Staphylococcus warneri]|uniref:hypothetical protein n=1 Tax=Staphylococcus warneri TaxID=1292 RepID=UPI001888E672|nr:hypothetical protein [Staphylococcus warneri]MBF2265081.1 hypothetical protein [Staphylococcus warneri]MBF2267514.1 hypothetical protein [Staphylococcus warneri]MBF2272146.1 hypothetical protein [Staphylococcus warneri]
MKISNESELREYDGYVFTVYKYSIPTYFIFDKNDMKFILDNKNRDSKGNYHFYLAEDKNSQYFDNRDGGLLLTGKVNAWEKLEKLL